ncbi:MAG: Wzz/FepE/Etk N-terminal domain-containing protein [Gallionellaceae bacterium]|nr:Wzz/FepE/Etk N-terminal domain-containing protein [Gallionellaceae bacterium]
MATEYELTFLDYLSILRRRMPYLIGIFVAVILIAVIVAIALPATYRATGTIMVESQQVPDNIVPSAIKTQIDERISIIKQRVMTRESLLRIANKYELFKEKSRSLTSSELIEAMRNQVGIDLISSDEMYSNQRGKATIAFMLSFQDKSPDIAYQVTNDLITLFLDWNVKLRTEGATETTVFLTQESEKLKLEVDRLEKLIETYKQQNSNNLPEQLTLRMTLLARAESDIREIERDIKSTTEDLRSLEVELDAAKYGTGDSLPETLPALKAEYAKLLATYNESYPDMKVLKRKIEALEKASEIPVSDDAPENAPTLAIYKIQSKIASAKTRLDSLIAQKKMLQGKIAQNERAMMLTPKVEQGLDILIRDRDSAQKKYEEIRSKKVSAQIAENLESENKSERFTLLEPPVLPEKAFKPNRVKIVAMGFFLAVASLIGAILVIASFDRQIRGADALAHVMGYRPLAVIPYLFIHEEWARRKQLLRQAVIITVCAVLIIALALHFLYMPLNVLLVKIFSGLA